MGVAMSSVRFSGILVLLAVLICLAACPMGAMADEGSLKIATVSDDVSDPELSVNIDFVSAERGEFAYLSAVPNGKVNLSQFSFRWEISTDKGKTWSTFMDEGVQTLRVKVDDPPRGHIGHMFRVVFGGGAFDSNGSNRGVTSHPVTIVAIEKFAVVMESATTLADGNVGFSTRLVNYDKAVDGAVSYTWEMSTVRGWEPIPGAANSPTWSIKVNPAVSSKNETSSDTDQVAITYYRVRATTASGKTAISSSQPITVLVPNPGQDEEDPWTIIGTDEDITKAYGCTPFKLSTEELGGGKCTFVSSNKKVAIVGKTSGKVTVRGIGKTTITISKISSKGRDIEMKKTVILTVTKGKNTAAVRVLPKSVKASKVKCDSATVKPIKATKAKGKVTYAKVAKGSSKRLTVNAKTGKITVKKGTKRGSYKIKVKVTANGNKYFKSKSQVVTVVVKVK